ncbi:MAG: extracellular solute-binding protein [Deltaproteobacteria bacterium]|nr:extracellular solute-binding protein [Deltaproteobacteria bacterium]MBW2150467.1 extracellular solute-binding protein [Deltaproteobacteria bacterium]
MLKKVFFAMLVFIMAMGSFIVIPDEVAAQKKITIANFGALRFDPAVMITNARFFRKYRIEVDVIEVPDTKIYEEISKSLALGESTFDVVNVNHYWMADFIRAGFFVPIPNYPKDQWESFSPAVKGAFAVGDKIYASPQWGNSRMLIYRKDYFKAAGLDPNKPPKTWDELVEYAKKLTIDKNKDGVIDQWGFYYAGGRPEYGLETFLQYLYASGGRMYDDKGKCIVNSKEGVAALQFLADLRNKYKVVPKGVADYTEGDNWDAIINGIAAMTVEEPMILFNTVKKNGVENVGAAMYPVRDLNHPKWGGIAVLCGFAVNAKSKNKEAAYKYCINYGTYQAQKTEIVDEGNIATVPAVFDDPDVRKAEIIGPYVDVLKGSVSRSVAERWPRYKETEDIMAKAILSAIIGQQTPQKALDKAAKQINALQ